MSVPNRAFEHASGTKSLVYLGDTTELCKTEEIAAYDIVISSPPWPEYDNSANGFDGVDWDSICRSLALLCKKAKGCSQVKGLVELPFDMSEENKTLFLNRIKELGLQIYGNGNHNPKGIVYGNFGNDTFREWYIILAEGSMIYNNFLNLIENIKQVSTVLSERTRSASNLKGLKAWNQAILYHHGTRVQAPPQYGYSHIKSILCTFVDSDSVILDPFCGTGTLLELSANYNISAIGIEKCRTYYDGIVGRLNYLTNPNLESIPYIKRTNTPSLQSLPLSQEEADDRSLMTMSEIKRYRLKVKSFEKTKFVLDRNVPGRRPRLYSMKRT